MDISSPKIVGIIRDLSKKYDVPEHVVRRTIISQFECVRHHMKRVDSYNDYFPKIRLPYLFMFNVNPRRRKFFVEKSKKIVEDVYSQQQSSTD